MNEKSSNAHSPQKPAKLLSSLALNNKKWHDIPLLSAVQCIHSTEYIQLPSSAIEYLFI